MTEMNEIDKKISEALSRGETACPEGVPAAKWEMSKALYLSSIQSAASQAVSSATTSAPTSTGMVPTQVPATLGNSNVPSAYSANPQSFDIDSVSSGGLGNVDGYIKLAFGQTSIGDKTINNPSFKAKIVIKDVIKKLSIRTNQPVKYYSTYDGIVSSEGTSWMQVIQEVQKIAPEARPYTSYEIPMILEEPLVQMSYVNNQPTTEIIMETGRVIGHTTPVTGRKPFEDVLQEIIRKGMKPSDCEVVVNISREDRNKNSQRWAVLKFDIVEIRDLSVAG